MHFPRSLQYLAAVAYAFAPFIAMGEAPPPGFVLHELKEINAKILKPDDWHVLLIPRQNEEGPLGYQFTKEDSDKVGGFKTGLTINVFEKVPAHHSAKPSEFAATLMKRYTANGEVLTFRDGIKAGPIEIVRLRLKKNLTLLGKKTETMLMFTTMANDRTGTLYVFIFGTPAEEWEANEKILAKMSQATLDDER